MVEFGTHDLTHGAGAAVGDPSGLDDAPARPRREIFFVLPARRWRTPSGFTLLEMLVVLAIIGLLVALVGPRLLARLDASKVTTTETQIRMLRTALDTMRLDIGRYPTTEEGLRLLVAEPSDPDLRAKWRGPYLEGDLPDDAWGHPYNYAFTGTGYPPFALYSYGPDGKPSSDGSNSKEIGVLPHG
jgi:general secretion pathway protein G